ncbi:hypothetical protein GDO78_009404 [Eleutherodactylus coqui]|uniref:Uncharacterized protein n=1 Tax=Eleutherodactylus coqui TaxID=57060 RepID=A0A8J6K9E4_ELECQ|nr:hypothetical protein GDO78_009404 [Eleutherodactylus coqui]
MRGDRPRHRGSAASKAGWSLAVVVTRRISPLRSLHHRPISNFTENSRLGHHRNPLGEHPAWQRPIKRPLIQCSKMLLTSWKIVFGEYRIQEKE